MKRISAVFFLVLLCCATAGAKGNFQAEGVFTQVRKDERELVFTFTGHISLPYPTAPANHEKRQWDTIELHDTAVTIRISPGIGSNGRPFEGHVFDLERGHQTIAGLATDGRKVLMAIDNPVLTFSNLGEVREISGTYVYARLAQD